VIARDNRFWSYMDPDEYEFLTITKGPVWSSPKNLISVENSSLNGGETYQDRRRYLMYATYFFLGENRIEHNRNVQTLIGVMSSFGGFSAAIFFIIAPIAVYINQRLFMGYIIRTLFDHYRESAKAGSEEASGDEDR